MTEPVDYAAVWSAATDLLNDEIVSPAAPAYLRLTLLRAIVDDTALLAVPDAFTRDVIESQLRPAITEALSRHLGRPIQVAVTVRPPEEAPRPNALTAPTAVVAMVPVPKRAEQVRRRPSRARPHVPATRDPADTLFDESDLPSLTELGNRPSRRAVPADR